MHIYMDNKIKLKKTNKIAFIKRYNVKKYKEIFNTVS
jgi:hypothetical protein